MEGDSPASTGANGLAAGLDADLPPRRGELIAPESAGISREAPTAAVNPEELDGPDDLVVDEEAVTRAALPSVAWPSSDADAPDFAHLIPEGREPLVGDRRFKFGADELELLIRANAFAPEGYDNRIVFALRGARLVSGDQAESVERIELEDVRPDHRGFRCVIGYYNRSARKLSAYKASTVPNVKFMTNYYQWKNGLGGDSSTGANMLPTGCYVFRVGTHGGGRIYPALRLTNPDKLNEDGAVTVLRTHNDLTFKSDDLWDKCTPYDHVHCAYAFDSFSSAGCLTICGPDGSGPWGRFQGVLKSMKANTRLDLVLLTGREASIAAYLVESGRATDEEYVARLLGRLRNGSTGNAVSRLQQRLGTSPTGYFGGVTKKLLADQQRGNKLRSDGIYSSALDERLAWGVMAEPPPPQPAEAPAPTEQPMPAVVPEPQVSTAPAPSSPEPEVEIASAGPVAGGADDVAVRDRVYASPTAPTETAGVRSQSQSVPAAAPHLLITPERLACFAPRALPEYRDALLAGNEVLALYGISETPERLCHFLAQIANQCGQLAVLEEDLNFTSAAGIRSVWPTRFPTLASAESYVQNPRALADRVYGDRFDNRPGDGWRYRGRGFVQLTGRSNYREMGSKLGIPLEDKPDLAANAEHALTIACETWMAQQLAGERDMNRLADLNKLEAMTCRMTGAYTDLDKRRDTFLAAWAIWGEGAPPDRIREANVLERGDRGGRVDELNARLKFLKLFDGIVMEPPQHVFTVATYKALRRLHEGQELALNGVAGGDTWGALNAAMERALRGPSTRSMIRSILKAASTPGEAASAVDLTERRLAEVRGWSITLAFFALAFVALYIFALIEPGRLGRSTIWWPLLFAAAVFVAGVGMWLAARLPAARPRRGRTVRTRGWTRPRAASGSFVAGEEEPVRQGINLEAAGK